MLEMAIGRLGLVSILVFVFWVYFINFTKAGRSFFFNKHLLLMRQCAQKLVGYVMGLSRAIGYKTATVIAIILALLINTVLIKALHFHPFVYFYPKSPAGESFLIMLLGSVFGVILLWGQLAILTCFLRLRIKHKNDVVNALECITFPVTNFRSATVNLCVGFGVIFVALCGLYLLNGIPENIASSFLLIIKYFLLSIADILLIIKNLIFLFIVLSLLSIFTKRLELIVITNEWVSVLGFSVFPVKLQVLMMDFSPIIAIWICGIVHTILHGLLHG